MMGGSHTRASWLGTAIALASPGFAWCALALLAGCGAPATDSVGKSTQGVASGGTYNLGALAHPGSCLDARSGGTTNGTQLQEWTCNGTGAQSYELRDDGDGDGAVFLVNTQANKCVDVQAAGTADGTRIQLYDCNGTGAQKFAQQDAGNGFVYLVNTHSNKCLDVQADNPNDGTVVQLYECNQTNAQKWNPTPIDGGSGSSSGGGSGSGSGGGGSSGGGGTCADGNDPLKTGNPQQDAYDCVLIALAQMYGDPDPMMAKAQIEQESGFDVLATSPDSPCGDPNGWTDAESKSFGLIQVTPACGEESGALLSNGHPNLETNMSSPLWATSAYNPTVNLNAGIQSIAGSLRDLENSYPGCTPAQYMEMSAGAFNSGESAVTGCAQFNSRAQGYVNAVLDHYRQFAQAAGWPDPY